MSQLELLSLLANVLNQLGVQWMLVGSHASSYYGEARSTHDVDIVVDFPIEKTAELLSAIPSDRYYLSDAAIKEGRMANLIDTKTGDKVDMFFVGDDHSAKAQLLRRKEATILDEHVFVASVEDTIVSKLKWNDAVGGSDRQINDVRGIINIQGTAIDYDVLDARIDAAGLRGTWDQHIKPWLEASR